MIEELIEIIDIEIAKNQTVVECAEKDMDSTFMETAMEKSEKNVKQGQERFSI